MNIFDKLIDKLKETPRTIVLPDGPDQRVMDAAEKLTKQNILKVILVGTQAEFDEAAKAKGYDLSKCEILDPKNYADMDAMVTKMVELRKGKLSEDEAREMLSHGNYFGTMLVKMGKADCLLGGATYSTADTVRPALQLIKTKPGAHLVRTQLTRKEM